MLKIEKYSLQRLTALWAFSEAALGGLLHALHLPFSGIVLTGFAVIFISLIARYSPNKTDILKSLAIVIAVKFAVSPHTPFGAYVSVFFQGISGYIIFRFIKNYFSAAFILSILAMLISSFQKIIVYAVVFGYQLIDSVNLFLKIATEQIPLLKNLPEGFNFSLVIVSVYLTIYFLAGIILGIIVSKLPNWLDIAADSEDYKKYNLVPIENINSLEIVKRNKRKKRKLIFVFLFIAIVLLALSYFFPQYEKIQSAKLLFMLLRAILVLMIWYFFLLPIFSKLITRLLIKRQAKYASEVEEIIKMFPSLKRIFLFGWQKAKGKNLLFRVKYFLIYFIIAFLTEE